MASIILAFSGQRDSGKSTIVEYVTTTLRTNFNRSVTIFNYSEPIYKVMEAFGFSRDLIDDKVYRNVPQDMFKGKTLIEMMVLFGTGFARDTINEKIWIDVLQAKMKSCKDQVLVVENVRFENEKAELQKAFGERVVFVGVQTHLSLIDSPAEEYIPVLVNEADIPIDNRQYPLIKTNADVTSVINTAVASGPSFEYPHQAGPSTLQGLEYNDPILKPKPK